MSDRSGQTLDHYRLETIIGHGSMADVYRATHLGLDETVAVKIIHPHLLDQPNLLERFRREAAAIGSLRHPHIVRLFDFACRADAAYMVMEYLAGGTLEQRLTMAHDAGHRLAPSLAARWIAAIAGAVDLAHSRGLIHRDLKPSNILFREDGEPVLTDFGLAFLADRSRLSPSNSMTGTPMYLSPEQARGMPGDARSDIYSLGVILYEILVGQTPFQGPTVSVAMKHITEAPPSPRQLGRYLTPEVEGVIMRALAKNPVERYQSAGALALALNSAVRLAEANEQRNAEANSRRAAGVAKTATSPAAAGAAPAAGAGVTRHGAAPAKEPAAARPPNGTLTGRQIWRATALVLLSSMLAFATWGLITHAADSNGPATSPMFSPGAEVRLVVPGQTSTSVLRGCPTGFWMGVLGLATDGDDARVIARKVCGNDWWYEIVLPGSATSAWDGRGWVSGAYLTPR